MIVLSLDLEMNQPSENIIQIGAVTGDILTGEITGRCTLLVKLPEGEVVSPFITNLTGIEQSDLDLYGLTLEQAYEELKDFMKASGAFLNPITWGGGDSAFLREQLEKIRGPQAGWCFGRRWIDIKTMYVAYRMINGHHVSGGLAKAMTKFGMQFKGRKHDALDDAENTFYFACKLFELLKIKPS